MAMVGLSSTTYATRATTAATRVDPHFKSFTMNVLLDVGGPSDLLADLTAAQVLSAAESYADARRTAGATKVVGFTVTPSSSYSAGQETQRVAYNALLKVSSHFDAIVDMAALPHAADATNLTYFYDGLHPTEALAIEIAQLAKATLASIGIV